MRCTLNHTLILAGLAGLTLAVFWPLHTAGFIHLDDPEYVTRNPLVANGLTADGLHMAWTRFYAGFWAPVLWTSYMLDVELFGMNPGAMHLVNVFWHAVNALLLFGVLHKATGALWRSAAVAAVFAVHPLRVESVAWVTERKDVLSTCFGLLSIWAYIHYARTARRLPYILAAVCFTLSLMVKPMLVTLPCVLLLLDWWPLGRFERGRVLKRVGEKLPLFALAGLFGMLTVLGHAQSGGIVDTGTFPLEIRIAYATTTYVWYLLKLAWPTGLAFFYPHEGGSQAVWAVAGAGAVLGVATGAVVLMARRRAYLLTGWLWYLLTLAPTVGLIQAGAAARADRFTYVPLIGVCLMIVWGLPEAAGRRRYAAGLAFCGAAYLAVLAPLSRAQAAAWQDTERLSRQALEATRENFMAATLLGIALVEQGKEEEAVGPFQWAVQWNPRFYMPYVHLGRIAEKNGRTDEALGYYARAHRLDPALPDVQLVFARALQRQGRTGRALDLYLDLLRRYPSDPQIHHAVGTVYEAMEDPELALLHYAEAARLEVRYAPDRDRLARGRQEGSARDFTPAHRLRRAHRFAGLGQYRAALEAYRAALAQQPDQPEAYLGMGRVYQAQDSTAQAAEMYRKALARDPALVAARLDLGALHAKQHRPDLAATEYEAVIRLMPDQPEAHFFLGNIRLAAGDLKAARSHYETVLRADPAHDAARRRLEYVNRKSGE
jgi:tetratricopeptide (TPR) repeat protein